MSAGSVDYLLRGSGCAEHEHAPAKEADGVGYMLAGAEREPAGVWGGHGLGMIGMTAGTAVTEEQVRAVFGRLEHPTAVTADGSPVALGNRPRKFKTRDQRIALALAREPDATEERRAEIANEVRAETRKAVAYYDLTFSPVKSVSVYWAALLEAGQHAQAQAVVDAHHAGIRAAMEYVEREAAYVRSGYHGRTSSGLSVGVHERGEGLSWVRWDHSTSRAQQPQMHSHVTVLNRLVTASDGEIRSLNGRAFRPIKEGADAIYQQVSQTALAQSNGVVFALRPDGKATEIMGVDQQLCAKASSRREQIAEAVQNAAKTFVERYGREPSPAERKEMDRTAWRQTRAAKNYEVAPRQQIDNWVNGVRGELRQSLRAVGQQAALVQRHGHPDQRGYADRTKQEVLHAAVAAVELRHSTWQVGNLVRAVNDELLRTPRLEEGAEDLAREILDNPSEYGVVLTSPPDPAPVPEVLRRDDGHSRYRQHNFERWTTARQLTVESGIVARAREIGAPALAGPELELARVELIAAGLGVDQVDAVMETLSSGRRGDVLIGPAGTGKSRTIGALARIWPQHVGGRVLGLATSQMATQVLAEDGLDALNTTAFLQRYAPDENGVVRAQLGRGDLVVIDEAGMSSTTELDRISKIVATAGAKLLYTGDHEQLVAVGAGGMLDLLVRDNGAAELTEVRRFHDEWEREASMRLRVGDGDVLAVYDQHGRVRGGTADEMAEAAGRGYLADVLAGKESLLIVQDNDTARDMSAAIRAELITAGRVGHEVLGQTRDGNLVSAGDRIQTRQNDYNLRVDGRGGVYNRDVWTVLDKDPMSGALRVQKGDGLIAHLPSEYVAKHTTLAYAVTVHAAQGATVDTTHDLVSPSLSRNALYVMLSRGRENNTAYVPCRREADQHDHEAVDRSPLDVLAEILDRAPDGASAAEVERRVGIEEARSLAWVGAQWDLLTTEFGRDRYTDQLATLLGHEQMDELVAEPRYDQLMAAVRSAELDGHDPSAVLREAVRARGLGGAESVADVLRYRVNMAAASRTPERRVSAGDWSSYIDDLGGPVGEFEAALSRAATERQAELGQRVADEIPEWAREAPALGTPPTDGPERAEWIRRAGIVAAYRDMHSVPDEQLSLGAAPDKRRAFHHLLWKQAHAALGYPADSLDYAAATVAQLREMRAEWQREQTWAPPYVEQELRAARELADEYRRDSIIWAAGLDQLADGSNERREAERDVAAARRLSALQERRVEALSAVAEVRKEWFEQTTAVRVQAALAGEELERRGEARELVQIGGEQEELFAINESRIERRTERRRALDPAQEELDLPGVPSASPQTSAPGESRGRAQTSADKKAEIGTDLHEVAVGQGYADVRREEAEAARARAGQPELFPTTPEVRDVVAAQPVREGDRNREVSTGPDEAAPLTVGNALRIAIVSRALRKEIRAAHTDASRVDEHTDIGIGAPVSRTPEVELVNAENERQRRRGTGVGR